MTGLLWLASALAAPPTSAPQPPAPPHPQATGMLPWAAPWAVQEHYDGFRAQSGNPPRQLACGVLWKDAVRLCLQREVGGRLVRVHTDELGGGFSDARANLAEQAATWVRAEVETLPVEGMEATYRQVRDTRGRAVLAVLAPEVLAEDLGLPLVVGIPSTGVVLAWKGGDPDLDKILAVGLREMHERARDPVSAVAWAWDGERWFAFAEATATLEPEDPDPSGRDAPAP